VTVPGDPTREQPAVEPSVSTAPAPGRPRGWWSAIPRHLGRARTSTVIIALLFLAIGTLYLYVKPDPVAATQTGDTGVVTEPAPTTGGPTTTPPPSSTQPAPAPTTKVDPTTVPSTTTEAPPESTVPTTESVPPPTTETAPVPTVPTTETPTG
jgi:hypothetical protein